MPMRQVSKMMASKVEEYKIYREEQKREMGQPKTDLIEQKDD